MDIAAVKLADTKNFLDIVKICDVAISEGDILDCHRIGKRSDDNKCRPVLVKLSSNEKKRKLFFRLGKFKQHQEENRGPEENANNKPFINISHDMTQDQRKEKKSILAEAKNLNSQLARDSRFRWLVRGPPWDMKLWKVAQPQAQAIQE